MKHLGKVLNDGSCLSASRQLDTHVCDNCGHGMSDNEAKLRKALVVADKALEHSRDALGKVSVYPWDSESELDDHVVESLERIDTVRTEIANILEGKE